MLALSNPGDGRPPATCWQGVSPFGDPPRQIGSDAAARTRMRPKSREPKVLQKRRSDNRGLVAMLEESLARGHWRVALRRYAMLNASGQPVPVGLRARCKPLAALMTRRELAQVIADALEWAAFAEMGRAAAPRSITKAK